MITTTLSSKNQITLPKFVLQILGVEKGEKFFVETEDGVIKLKAAGKSVVDSLIGSIKIPKSKRGIPFDKVLEETKRMAAKELALK
jgi:bifunctional DNA-binding transcriptional regulator/antitoxin component of YhaV-PrlF toxin-antitoxin module